MIARIARSRFPLFSRIAPHVPETRRGGADRRSRLTSRLKTSRTRPPTRSTPHRPPPTRHRRRPRRFEKAREDYRHSRQGDIDSLNQKIADLDAQEKTATGKTRASLDANLPAIHAQRDAFVNDMRGLQMATSATWDSARARIDSEWDG